MGLLVSLLFLYMTFPLRQIKSIEFHDALHGIWGLKNQWVDQDGILTLKLDSNSGSGFKSKNHYLFGYFGAAVKLQPGDYTAGINTNIYLSNEKAHPGNHDEVDMEFLGHEEGMPYTLQTNVYIRGSGDGNNVIGREMKFHLWFDPAEDFHNYAISWSPTEILFFVDDVPIRRYARKSDAIFPTRPMWVYGSIWDASSWATEQGKYKADYDYQPFIGKYKNFELNGCTAGAAMCRAATGSPSGGSGLNRQEYAAMAWAQDNYMVYNYCRDPQRDHKLTPEC